MKSLKKLQQKRILACRTCMTQKIMGVNPNNPLAYGPDFLLVWTFFARCYGWGATGEYRLKIGDIAPTGAGWPKILDRRGRPPTNHSFSQKTRLYDLSYDIKIWTDLSSILSQSMHADGRTDRQTEFLSLDRVCIACSAVKTKKENIMEVKSLTKAAISVRYAGLA